MTKQREGVIYKIIYNKKIIYIGRSLDYKTRLRAYKSKIYDNTAVSYNNKLYKFMRENKCTIQIIKGFKINSEKDYSNFKQSEKSYIQIHNPALNTHKAY